ncbi:hypothetical protein [Halohasta salina]|uniref:hypothetical protein n=1 Tax=Halohasta salina TaxID=2961621 RepID=UPI0020A27733|nr:hypothetical protein [Halohasta salina]
MNPTGHHSEQSTHSQTDTTDGDTAGSGSATTIGRRGYLSLAAAGAAGAAAPVIGGGSVAAQTEPGYGTGQYGAGGFGFPGAGSDSDGDETVDEPTLAVTTDGADATSPSSVTVTGTVAELSEPATVFFEYRQADADGWSTTATEQLTEGGSFDRTVSGLSPSTTYEYRAVAEADETATGDVATVTTPAAAETTPEIDRLAVEDVPASDGQADLLVDWGVSDADSDLQSVIILVTDYRQTIQWELVYTDGATASGIEPFRVDVGDDRYYEVTVSATDTAGNQTVRRETVLD